MEVSGWPRLRYLRLVADSGHDPAVFVEKETAFGDASWKTWICGIKTVSMENPLRRVRNPTPSEIVFSDGLQPSLADEISLRPWSPTQQIYVKPVSTRSKEQGVSTHQQSLKYNTKFSDQLKMPSYNYIIRPMSQKPSASSLQFFKSKPVIYTRKERAFLNKLTNEQAFIRRKESTLKMSIDEMRQAEEKMVREMDMLQNKITELNIALCESIVKDNTVLLNAGANTKNIGMLSGLDYRMKDLTLLIDKECDTHRKKEIEQFVLKEQMKRVNAVMLLKKKVQVVGSQKTILREQIDILVNEMNEARENLASADKNIKKERDSLIQEKAAKIKEDTSQTSITSSGAHIVTLTLEEEERRRYLVETELKVLRKDKIKQKQEADKAFKEEYNKEFNAYKQEQQDLEKATRQDFETHLSIRRKLGEERRVVPETLQPKKSENGRIVELTDNTAAQINQEKKWSRLQTQYDRHAVKVKEDADKAAKKAAEKATKTAAKTAKMRRKKMRKQWISGKAKQGKVIKKRAQRIFVSCTNFTSHTLQKLDFRPCVRKANQKLQLQYKNFHGKTLKIKDTYTSHTERISQRIKQASHFIASTSKTKTKLLTDATSKWTANVKNNTKWVKTVLEEAALVSGKQMVQMMKTTAKRLAKLIEENQRKDFKKSKRKWQRKTTQKNGTAQLKELFTALNPIDAFRKFLFIINFRNALLFDKSRKLQDRTDIDDYDDVRVCIMFGKDKKKNPLRDIKEEYSEILREEKRYDKMLRPAEEGVLNITKTKLLDDIDKRILRRRARKRTAIQIYEPYEYQLGRQLEEDEIFTLFLERMKMKKEMLKLKRLSGENEDDAVIEVPRIEKDGLSSKMQLSQSEAYLAPSQKLKAFQESEYVHQFLRWENMVLIDDFNNGRTDIIYDYLEKNSLVNQKRKVRRRYMALDMNTVEPGRIKEMLAEMKDLQVNDDPELQELIDDLKKVNLDETDAKELRDMFEAIMSIV